MGIRDSDEEELRWPELVEGDINGDWPTNGDHSVDVVSPGNASLVTWVDEESCDISDGNWSITGGVPLWWSSCSNSSANEIALWT